MGDVVQARGLPVRSVMVYQRKQNRLAHYDYSQPGFYFITICTEKRKEYFGEVVNAKMILNDLGRTVEKIWKRNPEIYQNIKIDEFIVMPNHMHGILVIEQAEGPHYNLSKIVGSFKNVATKEIRLLQSDFRWQPTFYDHVIRKDESLNKIREYIANNPLKWELDRNNLANLWM